MSDPYAHIRIGDPDPTPDTGVPCCDGLSPRELNVLGLQFLCTREPDHGPWPHVAGDGKTVLSMWSWDLDLETQLTPEDISDEETAGIEEAEELVRGDVVSTSGVLPVV